MTASSPVGSLLLQLCFLHHAWHTHEPAARPVEIGIPVASFNTDLLNLPRPSLNTLAIGLCTAGFIEGLIQCITHCYKFLQLICLALKIISHGLLINKNGTHTDVALTIALLDVSPAFSADYILFLPVSALTNKRWRAVTAIKAYHESPLHHGVMKAYTATVDPLWAGTPGLSFIALVAVCFQSNYYLGEVQNAWDNKDTEGNIIANEPGHPVKATTWRCIAHCWDLCE
ncbi:hypothetical protein JCM10450v2_008329 [Rhodotorula kratochvilovae]